MASQKHLKCVLAGLLCLISGPLSFGLQNSAWSHGLDCNQPTIEFDEALSHNFLNSDLSSSGLLWGNLNDCGMSNLVSGIGQAACIKVPVAAAGPIDSVIESFDFFLGCKASASLSFLATFVPGSADSALVLEVLAADSDQWQVLLDWREAHGSPQSASGENVQIDLSSFAASGFAPTKVRWRFLELAPDGSTAFAQIDKIELDCQDAPHADLHLALGVSQSTQLKVGEQAKLTLRVANFGPAVAQAQKLQLSWDPNLSVSSATSFPVTASNNALEIDLGNNSSSFDKQLQFSVLAAQLGLGNVNLNASVQSETCDLRLSNNNINVKFQVSAADTPDGQPDANSDDDTCPFMELLTNAEKFNSYLKQIRSLRKNTSVNRSARASKAAKKLFRSVLSLDKVKNSSATYRDFKAKRRKIQRLLKVFTEAEPLERSRARRNILRFIKTVDAAVRCLP